REIVGAGSLAALLVQLSTRLRGLQDRLRDSTRTRFVIVTRPAAIPAGESEALSSALQSLGIHTGAVVVNAVGAGSCRRCRAIAKAQRAQIDRLRKPGRYTIIEAPAEVPPPHGVAALRA